MLRRLHSLPGLVLALLLVAVAVTGAALSVVPTLDRWTTPAIERGVSVAALAEAVAARHEAVSTIRVRSTGVVTAAYTDGETSGVERIDPATGAGLGEQRVSPTVRFLTDLHRALAFGETCRTAVAVGGVAMLILALTGLPLTARRLGGWRSFFGPIRGHGAERLHGELARLAVVGLLLSSLTAAWMSASTFGFLPERGGDLPAVTASEAAPSPVGGLAALKAVDVADLDELGFPEPGVSGDVFRLTSRAGEAAIDPATGETLAFVPATLFDRIDRIVRMLHTGRGAWAVGLVLGLSAAAVPVLAGTGVSMWYRRRKLAAPRRATTSVPAATADTVILVGSETGSTRGFADTLAGALTATGHRVHVADMNDLDEAHTRAERLLILTSSWGDGGAPASASRFLDRLASASGRPPVAVLGFGDRNYPDFCGHARTVARALAAAGFPELLDTKRIDRRSAQEFARWGQDLGHVLGHDLVLEHVAEPAKTGPLELVGREDYGEAVGAPVAILRFAAPSGRRGRPGRLPDFAAGDLLGIVPPGEIVPRFYSLASSTADGVAEICVRLMPGGVCSGFLHGLAAGGRIDAFVRPNPSFHPAAGRTPLILIGAGTGIGPLAGFVRANDGSRPVHLYWGGRSPASDFLYEHELARHLAEKRLTSLTTAFSRDPTAGAHVQDRIAADAPRLRELIRQGGQILVCGSRDMGAAVTRTLDTVVRPLGLDLATLRAGGRYVEDVY